MNSGGGAAEDRRWMRAALRLARRGYGSTSPNPMVGALLVRRGRVLGRGWHRRAGLPHAEIEAFRDAAQAGRETRGATLYVTLEPCCTHGRTPPCTDAIRASGVARVVVGAVDPNPAHAGRGLGILREAGIEVVEGLLAEPSVELNESFHHWIVHRTPWVVLKAAMTLDGKIATVSGESKWITGGRARAEGMRLRAGSDAIVAGVNTILADDPSLTVRGRWLRGTPRLRRVILDSRGRTPVNARVVSDEAAALTTVVVTGRASARRREALSRRVRVLVAPEDPEGRVDLRWLMSRLGAESVTQVLVEGGGEVCGAAVRAGLVHRVAFFYAPLLVGGRGAPVGVAGVGAEDRAGLRRLDGVRWRRLGDDLYYTARVSSAAG